MLTQSRLKELLDYRPQTGLFHWNVSNSNRVKVGSVAGSEERKGYIGIRVDGKQYRAHRLAFLYMTGEFPTHQVDHDNQVRYDNRWSNLKEATNQENHKNMPLRSDNTSGCVGVYLNKVSGKWVARIKAHGKHLHLGVFEDKTDAIEARKKAEVLYGFHPNHGHKLGELSDN